MERTLGAAATALNWRGNVGRCENASQLVAELGKILGSIEVSDKRDSIRRRLVLVYDGIDRQRDAAPTLLAALARISEIVSP